MISRRANRRGMSTMADLDREGILVAARCRLVYAEELSFNGFDWTVLHHYADGSALLATYEVFSPNNIVLHPPSARAVKDHERPALAMQARAYRSE